MKKVIFSVLRQNKYSISKYGVYSTKTKEEWLEYFGERVKIGFPNHMKYELVELKEGYAKGRIILEKFHLAPNGFIHGGVMAFLADTTCGYACVSHLPDHNCNYATAEFNISLLSSTTRIGSNIVAEANLLHSGKSSQVWEAKVFDQISDTEKKLLASFRCTQVVLNNRKKMDKTLSDLESGFKLGKWGSLQ